MVMNCYYVIKTFSNIDVDIFYKLEKNRLLTNK